MLKRKRDNLDGLSEEIVALYKKVDDVYILQAENEDVTGLKNKVDELLGKLSNEKDAKEEAVRAAKEAARAKAKEDGDIEAIEKSWKDKLAAKELELTQKIESKEAFIRSMLVDSTAVSVANEISDSPELLELAIKPRLTVDEKDGQPFTRVLDAEGKPSAMTVEELKKEFIDNAKYAAVIKGSQATGCGARGNSGNGGQAAKNWGDYSEAELVHISKNNPEMYKEIKNTI